MIYVILNANNNTKIVALWFKCAAIVFFLVCVYFVLCCIVRSALINPPRQTHKNKMLAGIHIKFIFSYIYIYLFQWNSMNSAAMYIICIAIMLYDYYVWLTCHHPNTRERSRSAVIEPFSYNNLNRQYYIMC